MSAKPAIGRRIAFIRLTREETMYGVCPELGSHDGAPSPPKCQFFVKIPDFHVPPIDNVRQKRYNICKL